MAKNGIFNASHSTGVAGKPLRVVMGAVVAFAIVSCGHYRIVDANGSTLSREEELKLASVYEAKGELKIAALHYEKALKTGQDDAGVWFVLANVYLKTGSYKEAETAYKKALELKPDNPAYLNNIAWLYMEMKDYPIAEQFARAAVKKGTASLHAYLDTLGAIQTAEKKYAEAEDTLKEAEAQAPPAEKEGLRQIYLHQLSLYRLTGNSAKAGAVQEKLQRPD